MVDMPIILDTIPSTQVSEPPLFPICECFLYDVRFLLFISQEISRITQFHVF